MEEKNKVIKRLKNFIMNNNESILVGSLGSSMISKEERKIDDQSSISKVSEDSSEEKEDQ